MTLVRDLSAASMTILLVIIAWIIVASDRHQEHDYIESHIETPVSNSQSVFAKPLLAKSFITPMPGLPAVERIPFRIGESFFSDPWLIAPASTTLRDGLGPYFNARSCTACHVKGGRSDTPSTTGKTKNIQVRLARRDQLNSIGSESDPIYGRHLQPFAVPRIAASHDHVEEGHALSRGEGWLSVNYEKITGYYDDGQSYELRRPRYDLHGLAYGDLHKDTAISFRIAPSLAGAGLLEAIPDEIIAANADPYDRNSDGISGKLNYVINEFGNKDAIGRFGHKAHHATISSQTAAAFRDDIGITSDIFPNESCSELQEQCKKIPNGINEGSNVEIESKLLSQVADFVRLLAPPPSLINRTADNGDSPVLGKKLFEEASCSKCHTPSYITVNNAAIDLLSSRLIYPYTDLLLHDMGAELGDDHVEYQATGSEWRTAPLWGLSQSMRLNSDTGLLHDGRARDISEAILWHGGEAETSKLRFLAMSAQQRSNLIQFIESL